MNKKVVVLAFAAAFAVPYVAKLIAKRNSGVAQLERQLSDVNKEIKAVNKEIRRVENMCERMQTRGMCGYASQDIPVKTFKLRGLKQKRANIKKQIEQRKQQVNRGRTR